MVWPQCVLLQNNRLRLSIKIICYKFRCLTFLQPDFLCFLFHFVNLFFIIKCLTLNFFCFDFLSLFVSDFFCNFLRLVYVMSRGVEYYFYHKKCRRKSGKQVRLKLSDYLCFLSTFLSVTAVSWGRDFLFPVITGQKEGVMVARYSGGW